MKKPPVWCIPFSDLKQGANRMSFEIDITEIGGEEREVSENPLFGDIVGLVKVELKIVRTGRRFLVDGTVRFRARLDCAVCGKAYESKYSEPLQTEFMSEGEVPPPDGKLLDGHDVERMSFKNDQLNIGPLVRDAVHLAVPMAPSCRPDCRGICSRCGKNLNEGPCDCSKQTDTPFAGVKELLEDRPLPRKPH